VSYFLAAGSISADGRANGSVSRNVAYGADAASWARMDGKSGRRCAQMHADDMMLNGIYERVIGYALQSQADLRAVQYPVRVVATV
jgi:hypothetical protein